MKYFILLGILFQSVLSFAVEYSAQFLAFDPSSINRAMGGNAIGVIDIWHNNPLTFYSNPAIASFHEGIAYGLTSYNMNAGVLENQAYFRSGMASVGYKGIAIIFPASCPDYSQGTYFRNERTICNTDFPYQSRGFESSKMTGLAINPMKLLKSIISEDSLFEAIDLAIGFSNNEIFSSHTTGSVGYGLKRTGAIVGKSSIKTLGTIATYNHMISNKVKTQFVIGVSDFNFARSRITYNRTEPIYSHQAIGFAVTTSLVAGKAMKEYFTSPFIVYGDDMSCRIMASYITSEYKEDVKGQGIEIDFLDTFFLRYGHYTDYALHINGTTQGAGFKLNLRNYMSIEWNIARFPWYRHYYNTSTDYSFNVNFYKVAGLIF